MKKRIVLPFLMLFLSFQVKSQTDLTRKDIVVVQSTSTFTERDHEIISNYNFDEHRFMNKRKKIKLVNGPLIELLSVKEVQKLGFEIAPEKLKSIAKKQEDFQHELILQLNIGLGIHEAYQPR